MRCTFRLTFGSDQSPRQTEIDLNICSHSNRFAVPHSGPESPLLHALNGFLIEAHTKRSSDVDLRCFPLWRDDNREGDRPLQLRIERFLRVLRVEFLKYLRRSSGKISLQNVTPTRTALTRFLALKCESESEQDRQHDCSIEIVLGDDCNEPDSLSLSQIVDFVAEIRQDG
jgi:hypothetical protein